MTSPKPSSPPEAKKPLPSLSERLNELAEQHDRDKVKRAKRHKKWRRK